MEIQYAQDGCTIDLGHRGETGVTQVIFDVSPWVKEFGAGAAVVLARRSVDRTPYPVAIEQDGGMVTWTVGAADTAYTGSGKVELYYYVQEQLVKTAVYKTSVSPDIGAQDADVPDQYQGWVDKITRVGTQAGIDAQSAAASAQAAADSAEGAAGSAANAGESAGAAEQSAQKAETAAGTATEQAGKAQTSEESAQRSATEASQSATTATDKAAEAAQSAQAAQQAQAAAETAQGKAEEAARQAAQSAETAGETALGAYVCKTAEGTVVSFDDGAENVPVKSCVVQIEPIQDLHGQDAPYPAGGGKNLFNPSPYADYLQSNGKYRTKAAYTAQKRTQIPASLLNTVCVFSVYMDLTNSGTLSNALVQVVIGGTVKRGNLIENGSTGRSEVSFTPTSTDDYVSIAYGSNGDNEYTYYDMQLESGSTATAYAPYSNICPISGHTQAVVTRTGKNLLELSPTTQTVNGVTFTVNDDGTISLSGTATQNTNYFLSSGERSFINGSFVFSGCPSGGGTSTYYLRIDNVKGGALAADYGDGRQFTIFDGKIYAVFINVKRGVNTNGLVFKPMIELGTTATTYEPYSGQSITIALGQTVYGGKLDVVSGVLVIDKAYIDLSTRTWDRSGYDWRYSGGTVNDMKSTQATGKDVNCSAYKPSASSWSTYNGPCICINTKTFILSDDRFVNDANGLKAWMQSMTTAGTPVTATYPLATPITVTLTPNELSTLLGANNIWADTGDVSVEYRADPTILYNKLTNAIISTGGNV